MTFVCPYQCTAGRAVGFLYTRVESLWWVYRAGQKEGSLWDSDSHWTGQRRLGACPVTDRAGRERGVLIMSIPPAVKPSFRIEHGIIILVIYRINGINRDTERQIPGILGIQFLHGGTVADLERVFGVICQNEQSPVVAWRDRGKFGAVVG